MLPVDGAPVLPEVGAAEGPELPIEPVVSVGPALLPPGAGDDDDDAGAEGAAAPPSSSRFPYPPGALA